MSLTLTQIAANTATVAIPIMGDTVNVAYFPNKITDQLIAQIDSGAIDDNQLLTDLISSWDIYEDDTRLALLAIDRIGELGIPIKVAIAQGIVGAMVPKQTPQA